MTDPPAAVIVVPCYNESGRLDGDAFERLARTTALAFLFVDDGSHDDTPALLCDLCGRLGGRGRLLRLDRNRGKGEAVRAGLRDALAGGAAVVGYLDADLATPGGEMARIVDVLRSGGHAAALGARVRLLGTRIRRRAVRHYLGRVFATCASLALRLPVYDTQCGAKAFRATPQLHAALADPFLSRWIFDVELIGRLLAGTAVVPGLRKSDFTEVPIARWEDVAGSKVRPADFVRAGVEFPRVWLDFRRRLRRSRAADRAGR